MPRHQPPAFRSAGARQDRYPSTAQGAHAADDTAERLPSATGSAQPQSAGHRWCRWSPPPTAASSPGRRRAGLPEPGSRSPNMIRPRRRRARAAFERMADFRSPAVERQPVPDHRGRRRSRREPAAVADLVGPSRCTSLFTECTRDAQIPAGLSAEQADSLSPAMNNPLRCTRTSMTARTSDRWGAPTTHAELTRPSGGSCPRAALVPGSGAVGHRRPPHGGLKIP